VCVSVLWAQVDPSTCDYIVDLVLPHPAENAEPHFNSPHFVSLWSEPYLHNPSSPSPYRSFFIPVLSPAANVYGEFHVLGNVDRLGKSVRKRNKSNTQGEPSRSDL